ncbi:hypothetical protein HGA92_02295 [Candidatus Gracilibacteria bacterium]|nr:hypothetical protein [Candidatus Gracilibacteria bacterium]NUJ99395.1 hypothetical protein [Candidatus Gracilibacteria bacterium]
MGVEQKELQLEMNTLVGELEYVKTYLHQDLKSSFIHFLYLLKNISKSKNFTSIGDLLNFSDIKDDDLDYIYEYFLSNKEILKKYIFQKNYLNESNNIPLVEEICNKNPGEVISQTKMNTNIIISDQGISLKSVPTRSNTTSGKSQEFINFLKETLKEKDTYIDLSDTKNLYEIMKKIQNSKITLLELLTELNTIISAYHIAPVNMQSVFSDEIISILNSAQSSGNLSNNELEKLKSLKLIKTGEQLVDSIISDCIEKIEVFF